MGPHGLAAADGSPADQLAIWWHGGGRNINADGLAIFPEWTLVPAAMPPRSRLYSLEPIGIATPKTESLTSYLSRLAAAHSVRVRDPVIGELLAHIRPPHRADGRHANLPAAFWRSETRALNGTRSLARRMMH